jgi:peptide/nickel transport system permease protein
MKRLRYILRRLILAALVLISVSIITFVIARVIPSDPAALWVGPRATREQLARARVELGLDQPLTVQYLRYAGKLARGDLGVSVKTHQPILRDLQIRLPATLELVIFGMAMAALIGVPLGVLAGARPNTWFDQATRFVSIVGVSMPTFWLGLLLQLLFFGRLQWLPLGGRIDRTTALYNPIETITGFNLIDAVLTGNWAGWSDALVHILLPALSLAAFSIGVTIRQTRATMLEVLQEKYIVAARAAGLSERTILFRLALKNALAPTLTILGLAFVYALTGALLVEVIFSWPGLGTYVTDAILNVDFPVIVTVTLVSTVFYVAVNLIIDLLQAMLDPRITLA